MTKTIFRNLILFEDDQLIVVNKPPFISSLADRRSRSNILEMARKYFPNIRLCHRLDKETSGCLILAKTDESYRNVSLQFQNRTLRKTYHALVAGLHNFKDECVDAPVYYRSGGVARIDFREGKPSQTYLTSIKAYRSHTLLEAVPVTGRLHQIRVHLAYINTPIVGDITYGGKPLYLSSIKPKYKSAKWEVEQPLIKRVALHAVSLQFNHPGGGEKEVKAPYCKDFRALLNQLEKQG